MTGGFSEALRGYACRSNLVLDIGCGSGASINTLRGRCGTLPHVIGVDLDLEGLEAARRAYGRFLVDLVCCDASMLPVKSSSIPVATMFLTLHEVDKRLVDKVLTEVWRVLRRGDTLLFVDKLLFDASKPSEELVMLTEELYHKALEYAKGVRPWGLSRLEEYMDKLSRHNFRLVPHEVIQGSYIDAGTFLRTWGRKTMKRQSR